MYLRPPVLFLIACLSFLTSVSHPLAALSEPESIASIDSNMAALLKKIEAAAGNYDSKVGDIDTKLLDYLVKNGSNRALLTAALPKSTEAHMSAIIASDKQARFYSWDTETGGTMHYFDSVVQYQSGGKFYCKVLHPEAKHEEGDLDCGQDYSDVRSVKTKSGKTIYLVAYSAYFATTAYCRSICAYEIVGPTIKLVEVFKTPKQLLSTIDCRVEGDPQWNENSFVKISKDGNTVHVPIINSAGVTGKFLIYRFDGERFVFDPQGK